MLQIHPIPAFEDNYFWLIQPDTQSTNAFIVDPGAAEPVYSALKTYGLSLTGILITHHHHDHIGGATELRQRFNVPIYGPKSNKIAQITNHLDDGERLALGPIQTSIITLPGHTRDHIGYFIAGDNNLLTPKQPVLFCGDTLFAAGCGRLFDGNIEQLFDSLQRIACLPDNTLIYCAHEYTLNNIRFARHIEPENTFLAAREIATTNLRKLDLPTIPNALKLEKQTNPFLRCHLPNIHQRVEQLSGLRATTDLEVFTLLRRLKDQF